jgi:hypothetical protein
MLPFKLMQIENVSNLSSSIRFSYHDAIISLPCLQYPRYFEPNNPGTFRPIKGCQNSLLLDIYVGYLRIAFWRDDPKMVEILFIND